MRWVVENVHSPVQTNSGYYTKDLSYPLFNATTTIPLKDWHLKSHNTAFKAPVHCVQYAELLGVWSQLGV